MENDTRTSDEIERDILDERAEMSDTLSDLQKKFSVDAIMTDLGDMVREQGGDLGRAIGDTLGRNPAAVVLVGVGLAWLFLGQDRQGTRLQTARSSGKRRDDVRLRASSGMAQVPNHPDDRPFRSDDQYWYGDGQMSSDYRLRDRGTNGSAMKAPGGANGSGGIAGTMRDAAHSVGNAVSDLTERLSHGLDDLSEDAKARILSARRAAHEARESSDALLSRGSRAASGFFEDQPLVVGALAVALGAAIGGALPHSKLEDDIIGDSSDQLFADAQALYRKERDKAIAALRTAAEDAKGEIREMGAELADLIPEGKSVGDVIVDRTSDAATRVINHASGNIEHQDKGTPRA